MQYLWLERGVAQRVLVATDISEPYFYAIIGLGKTSYDTWSKWRVVI